MYTRKFKNEWTKTWERWHTKAELEKKWEREHSASKELIEGLKRR
jgi:hypothetical protein